MTYVGANDYSPLPASTYGPRIVPKELPIPENEDAITAGWIQQALSSGGVSATPEIRDVATDDIGAGLGLVGKILRCHLSYRDVDSGGPETVIVKLPSSHSETVQTARTLGLYYREYACYRHVAPHIPVRSPALLYGDFDDSSHRFVLVLEDFREMAWVDQLDGASAEQAKTAVRAAARLHGRFWNKVDEPPISGFHESANPERRPVVRAVYQASLPSALNRFGHLFPDRMRSLAEEYGRSIVEYLDAVAAGPRTFSHGDFRLDNMFFGAVGNDEFAVVDWQVCGISTGLYDVAYFLSSSVAPEVRREIEREILSEYHQVLHSTGVEDFTLEECWRSYRQVMLGCLLTPIVAGGQLDFSSDRSRQLAEVFLTRTLTAIDDLDAHEFLPSR